MRGGEGGPGADIDPVSVVRESWGGGPESGVGPVTFNALSEPFVHIELLWASGPA